MEKLLNILEVYRITISKSQVIKVFEFIKHSNVTVYFNIHMLTINSILPLTVKCKAVPHHC